MRIFLFLLIFIFSYARENPFIPVVTNKNTNIIKQSFFHQKKMNLPNDARVLQSVTFTYQSLTGAIKHITFTINKHIDWHNPLILSTKLKHLAIKKIKVKFLSFYIQKHKVVIFTKDSMIRNFILAQPFRYVIDFRANKSFLSYMKKTNTFIKKIALGNHNGFYRVVLYLDGTYKPIIKKIEEGYLIEFK